MMYVMAICRMVDDDEVECLPDPVQGTMEIAVVARPQAGSTKL